MHCHKPPEMCYSQQTEPPDEAGEDCVGQGRFILVAPRAQRLPLITVSWIDKLSEEKCGPDTIPSLLAGYREHCKYPLSTV